MARTTPISITKEQLIELKPCGLEDRLALFGRRKSMTAKQAFAAGASISDLCWVAGKLGLKEQPVRFALACAGRAAHLNTDPRVQAALDATQAWLEDQTEERAARADAAYDAAFDAARAADAAARAAAFAAADATLAAAASAASAASAAYAAHAAHAAANAAGKREDEIKAQQALFLEIFG